MYASFVWTRYRNGLGPLFLSLTMPQMASIELPSALFLAARSIFIFSNLTEFGSLIFAAMVAFVFFYRRLIVELRGWRNLRPLCVIVELRGLWNLRLLCLIVELLGLLCVIVELRGWRTLRLRWEDRYRGYVGFIGPNE